MLLCLALAGCDVAFGLDAVTPDALEAPKHVVSGRIAFRYVANDASDAPVIDQRVLPRNNVALDVVLDDGTRADLEYRDDGTFTFTRRHADQRYRVRSVIDGVAAQLAHEAPEVQLAHLVAGRADRRMLQTARIEFAYPAMGTAQVPAYVASTGIYTLTGTGQYGPTVSLDWRLANVTSNGVTGLLDGTKHDRVYAYELESVSTTPTTFTRIRSVSSAMITQTASSLAVLPEPQPTAPTTCMRLVAPATSFHARLVEAAPRAFTASGVEWYAYMMPAPDQMGRSGALWVANSSVAPVKDLDIAPEFHDPYTGMTLVANVGATAFFQLQLPNTTPRRLANAIRVYDGAERGTPGSCTQVPTTFVSSVGLAGNVAFGGIALETDGQVVTLALEEEVEISWSQISPGPIDLTDLSVLEVVAQNGATAVVSRWRSQSVGRMTTRMEPGVFEPGHRYIVSVTTTRGWPNAVSGDMLPQGPASETGQIWSTWFEVQAL